MRMLPTGTVTFLFTDIQGSTRLWQEHPNAMPAALARHHALLRAAIESHGGYVFQIVGDAFCAAFATASNGVNAALAAQRALRDEPWGETGPLHVRMALETGPVEVRTGEYVSGEYASGITLSRAARLLSAGHGGQVLLAAATAELARDQLPGDVTLRDLGTHWLKDLEHPLRIFQLVALDLPFSFPLLKTADRPAYPLPLPLTRFVGRERELQEIKQLLSVARLVTLMGPGGAGKTRLSIEVARALVDQFQDGVAWLSLSEITDPSLVDSAIAHALNLNEMMSGRAGDLLQEYVRDRHMLLVIDNFEQVTAAAPLLAELLAAGPDLHLLVTSREALHIQGEQQYPVPPLGGTGAALSVEELLQQDSAVGLFCERARAVKPTFALTAENKQPVVEIVARLDGLPLAIELAAARIKMLSPSALLKQLGQSGLGLLTSTARDLPSRQQTLRGTIAWSYNLLPEDEQELFRRLGVFSGGTTVQAITAVCVSEGTEQDRLFDLLAALVDKSLVGQLEDGDETRLTMLDTISAYAREKLRERGEEETLRDRHLAYFLDLAEEAASGMLGPAQREWFERLEREMGNFREAFDWCKLDPARANAGLRMAAALGFYFLGHSHLSEGRVWLDEMLRLDPQPSEVVGKAFADLTLMVFLLGDMNRTLALAKQEEQVYRAMNNPAGIGHSLAHQAVYRIFLSEFGTARTLLSQGVPLLRQAGNKAWLADALSYYGLLGTFTGARQDDVRHAEEAISLYREIGSAAELASTLGTLGTIMLQQKNLLYARTLLEESIEQSRAAGSVFIEAINRCCLAQMALVQGDHDKAQAEARQSLQYYRPNNSRFYIPWALDLLALAALERGDAIDAQAYFRESLDLYRQSGRVLSIAESLAGFAGVALLKEDCIRGIRLLAASQNIADRVQGHLGPADAAIYERNLAQARSKVSPETFDQAWAEGYAMDLEPAMAYALQ